MGMARIQANFKLWPIFHSIYLIPTLNLRPGLDSAAFFTYIVRFPDFRLLSFMAYTYNIQGWQDRTRRRPPLAQPCDSHPMTAGIQANFKLWPIFCSIYLIPTLNLRPGLNLVAFFTYIVKFPAFRLLSFMAYTYNIQGWQDRSRHWPPLARPCDSHPVTAPQPHSLTLTTFNLININYDNL